MEGDIVFNKIDLRKHLNTLGFNDFETYENECSEQQKSGLHPKLHQQRTDFKNTGLNPSSIKLCDYKRVMTLLNSKLLFLEDVQFVEYFLSFCVISNDSFKNYVFGAAATSIVSMAAYFNRNLDPYLPIGCVAMSSIYVAWTFYQGISELNTNKQFVRFIDTLQNMCSIFHKLIRFIKEAEILSTGQVSTENVGSAMYKPLNSVSGLNELPPWKTCPDLRKLIADSLMDVITVFSRNLDDMNKFMPLWMDIKGFSLGSQALLKQMESVTESIRVCDGCISMKDLLILNDNYLLIQSEFLKWAAYYLCPVVWTDSCETYSCFKTEIVKVLKNTRTKFTAICLKLQLNCDLGSIFNCPITNHPVNVHSKSSTSREELRDFKNLQEELHNIFLLVLSTVQKAKGLEEYLESFSCNFNEGDLRKNLTQQLNSVKNDLEQVVQKYEYIYNLLIEKKKIHHEDVSEKAENVAALSSPYLLCDSSGDTRTKVGYSDLTVNSPDEVFLALSGMKSENLEFDSNDWFSEKKPHIPQNLLLELSTTLKPIKEDFEARERIALGRLGVQDIEISGNEDGESERLILNQSNSLNPIKGFQNKLNLCNSDAKVLLGNISSSKPDNFIQDETVSSSSSLRMADLLLQSSLSQQRKTLEEDCFSND